MTGADIFSLLVATGANAAPASPAAAPATGGWEPKDYFALITAITGIVALIVSSLISSRTLKASLANTEASIWQKANDGEVNEIQAQLDGFFGPFMRMSDVNRLLSRDLRARQADSQRFLLLESLFDREWLNNLPQGEKTLVTEIVANAKTLREFIAANAKMVNAKVQPYLSRAAAHYRVLELAHAGQLGNDAKPFVDLYVFPIQLDDVLTLEVKRLEKRKELIRSHPGKPIPPIEDLVISDSLKLKEWPKPARVPRPELNVPVEQK
ncbi:hypothetical protein [Bradyrhizobium sp. 2TAF24]|uniref:hypothetical protein n=1 Tax=Bradyrhizobium sp. 2TAF24 TaxID=3233011 RepID=UPI003F91E5F3